MVLRILLENNSRCIHHRHPVHRDFEGEVPGAAAKDCGNYLDMNLNMAKYLAKKYVDEVLDHISEERLVYPE